METRKRSFIFNYLLKKAFIAIGLTLVYVVAQTLITLSIVYASSFPALSLLVGIERLIFHLLFGVGVIALLWYLKREVIFQMSFKGAQRLSLKKTLIVFIAILSLMILCGPFYYWSEIWLLTEFPKDDYTYRGKFEAIGLSSFLILIVLVPIYEELFFRGFLFKTLINKTGQAYFSLLLSSTCFAFIHFGSQTPIISIFTAFIFGCLIAYILWKTDNLLYCIIGHSLYNLLIVLKIDYVTVNILMIGGFKWALIYWLLLILSLVLLVSSLRHLSPK